MTTNVETFGTVTMITDHDACTATLWLTPGRELTSGSQIDAAFTAWEHATGCDRKSPDIEWDNDPGRSWISLDWTELDHQLEADALREDVYGLVIEAPRAEPPRPAWA